jgi:hypothetical protein
MTQHYRCVVRVPVVAEVYVCMADARRRAELPWIPRLLSYPSTKLLAHCAVPGEENPHCRGLSWDEPSEPTGQFLEEAGYLLLSSGLILFKLAAQSVD